MSDWIWVTAVLYAVLLIACILTSRYLIVSVLWVVIFFASILYIGMELAAS